MVEKNQTAKRGGKRQGSGRKKGSKARKTINRQRAIKRAHKKVEAVLGPRAFKGDAVAFLALMYKDDTVPLGMRLDAAQAAAPYEKPKLQAITLGGSGDGVPIRIEALNASQLLDLIARIEKALGDSKGGGGS